MRHNCTKLLLSFAVSAFLFSSCKPKPDTDQPLPPDITPSVFIGSQNQFIYALNPTTGVKKWECFIGSDIKSSPVLHNNILFIGNASSTLFKLDPNTGARTASSFLFTGGISTVPVAKDSMIYVPYGSKITGLQIEKDKAIWTFTAGGTINSSPTISDTMLVFGCDDGSVYELDRRTGKQIWKTKNYATLFPSSPTVDTTRIYIGAENGKLYALKLKDGTEAWPPKQTDGPIKSSPLVFGGTIFFGSDDNKLYAAQILDGATVWTMTAGDRVRSSPFLQGQTIYVGSYDKSFYAVNVLDGSIKWTVKTDGLILSSPVYYNGRIYFGSYDKNFYAVDTAKGATTWKYAVNGLIDCSPAVDINNGEGINSTISGNSVY